MRVRISRNFASRLPLADVGKSLTHRGEASALVKHLEPDVVIMDLTMGDLDGLAATNAIVDDKLTTCALVLTTIRVRESPTRDAYSP
jgi:CheY-like chemotaxis protein